MRRSCTDWRNVGAPGMEASGPRRRAITSSDVRVRVSGEVRVMKRRPVLMAFPPPPPPPPVKPSTAATFSSLAIVLTTSASLSDIDWKEMSWDAWMPPARRPVSCCGKKPFGTTMKSFTLSATVPSVTSSIRNGWRSTQPRPWRYPVVMPSSARSRMLRRRFGFSSSWRRSAPHIIGVVVRETTSEMTTAAVRTAANSRNSRPMMPPMSRMGRNTATSETLIESTVKPISRAPCSAASRGFMPASTWRMMFSSTTMASSTTKPVLMVRAVSDRLSRL